MAEHYCEAFHFPLPHRFEERCGYAECLYCCRPAREHVCGKRARFLHCLRWLCADHFDERLASEEALRGTFRTYRLDAAVHDGIDIR